MSFQWATPYPPPGCKPLSFYVIELCLMLFCDQLSGSWRHIPHYFHHKRLIVGKYKSSFSVIYRYETSLGIDLYQRVFIFGSIQSLIKSSLTEKATIRGERKEGRKEEKKKKMLSGFWHGSLPNKLYNLVKRKATPCLTINRGT